MLLQIGLADFCVDPTSGVLNSISTSLSYYPTLQYYFTCVGTNDLETDITAISAIIMQMQNKVNTYSTSNTCSNTIITNMNIQLTNMNNILYIINNKVNNCATVNTPFINLTENAICYNTYYGLFTIFIATYFVVIILTLFVNIIGNINMLIKEEIDKFITQPTEDLFGKAGNCNTSNNSTDHNNSNNSHTLSNRKIHLSDQDGSGGGQSYDLSPHTSNKDNTLVVNPLVGRGLSPPLSNSLSPLNSPLPPHGANNRVNIGGINSPPLYAGVYNNKQVRVTHGVDEISTGQKSGKSDDNISVEDYSNFHRNQQQFVRNTANPLHFSMDTQQAHRETMLNLINYGHLVNGDKLHHPYNDARFGAAAGGAGRADDLHLSSPYVDRRAVGPQQGLAAEYQRLRQTIPDADTVTLTPTQDVPPIIYVPPVTAETKAGDEATDRVSFLSADQTEGRIR